MTIVRRCVLAAFALGIVATGLSAGEAVALGPLERLSIGPAGQTGAVAVDPLTGRAFITDATQPLIHVVDLRATPPVLIASVTTGGHTTTDVALDPVTGRVFATSLANGRLIVIDGRAIDPFLVTALSTAAVQGIDVDPAT